MDWNSSIPMQQHRGSGSSAAPRNSIPQRQASELTEADDTPDIFEDAQERWVFEASRASSPLPTVPAKESKELQCRRKTPTSSPKAAPQPLAAVPLQATVDEAIAPGAPSATGNETIYQKKCEQCEEHGKDVWYCNICDTSFCDPCWNGQFVHRKPPRGGLPHEKTDVNVAEKVQNVLSPPTDNWVREQLYKADEITSWFGVERPEDNAPPVFQDYGRFADLMASTDPIRSQPSFMERWAEVGRDRRTPSLVSFVGQTGAGKSTLVKLLIDFGLNGPAFFPTPVVGPRGAHLPTSEDVHLYLDPRTCDSPGPLLYADCEGLEGGEREPLGAKFRRMRRAHKDNPNESEAEAEAQARKASKIISERELEWASESRTRSREFAVTNLYPRLLYTFSDTIVFVLRNPRTIEHVFEKLVKWAAAAIETSSNQPVLPHAIIALNASEHDIDVKLWDVKFNTETILEDLAHTVNRNETFKKWSQFWRERGKAIDNLLDLVLCYYSTIQIIRLPAEGRPKLMAEQVEKLYKATLSGCIAARGARNKVRMLLDVEDMHAYLQEAFNHYSKTLESPFDFVQASFRNSPIPPDFGGNILKLALGMTQLWKDHPQIQAPQIFSELSYMVASCIMLDSSRHKNKGFADQIFPKYMDHVDDALENFCDQHWPCEFVNPKTGVRCVNVRFGHTAKGHQSADGKVFATGEYQSKFSFENNAHEFRQKVYSCLTQLLQQLTTDHRLGTSEERAALSIHQTMVMRSFFRRATHNSSSGKTHAALTSHTACFCCLFGQAEHCLPCGHVLCTQCLQGYGEQRNVHGYMIFGCPMEEIDGGREEACIIYLKPASAGVRILTLDGGGIRGVVELEVLEQIEIALGGIPIQCFFDLVVGTSTGGLVALGLGSMKWRVSECLEKFVKLCDEVFTRRSGSSLPIIGSFIENYHHSKYQTTTLENALQTAFTEDLLLFGGQRLPGTTLPLKVAVTATNLAGNKTYLLANYNQPRGSHKSSHYHFQRPEVNDTELKIWEALNTTPSARATAAAPRYFKSFHHELSHKTYIDGAVLHNNPIRIADSERKVLWPDVQVPDMILSLGTGGSAHLGRAASEHMSEARKGVFNHGRQLYSILRNNMQQTLDCERSWNEFFDNMVTALSTTSFTTSRFRRLNPDVGTIPALDEKDKIDDLRRRARESLRHDQSRIQDIARQLVASSFYLELLPIDSEPESDGKILVHARIQCRLPQPSVDVSNLGKHLLKRASQQNEEPKFVIFEDGDLTPLKVVPVSERAMNHMIRTGGFDLGRLRFHLQNKMRPTQIVMHFGESAMHPISGFPQLLFAADAAQPTSAKPSAVFPSSMPSTRYTHGSRRLKRTAGGWQPPDLKRVQKLSNLSMFAKRQAGLGDDGVGDSAGVEQPQPSTAPDSRASATTISPPFPLGDGSNASSSSLPKKRGGVRDAFKALLWSPSRENDSTEPAELSEDLRRWLDMYRDVQTRIKNANNHSFGQNQYNTGAPSVPDEQLAYSLQYYNVRPEEYAMYRQWVGLLQPSVAHSAGTPWLPPLVKASGGYASSSPAGVVHEMSADHALPAELPG
ncbi:FabD/lysophospholipase-like protein [Apiospora saccharicola]|uniref:FabD/lysophospholipase-like protein n=1 Tax=Apiospora saccharicola TaxID=335842 RepID=A0ABR1VNY4_9PEZI